MAKPVRLLFLGLIFAPFLSKSQSVSNSTRIAFYNVENLFHPDDDPAKIDEEFTPGGLRNWSEYRYREKLNRTAKAILSIGEWEPAAVVGLAEVENLQVLEDLVATPVLSKFGYEILHYESPDRRGIDVAMLYRKQEFELLFSKNIPLKMADDPDFASRDLLYAKGKINTGDTVHLVYCHWPSRYGGQAKSEPKRAAAAALARKLSDSIFMNDKDANLLIMGDLNDEWHDVSVSKTLAAQKEIPENAENVLVNLMARLSQNDGSHRYQGTWSFLDQIIITSQLLDGENLEILDGVAQVSRHSFLLEKDEKYPGNRPFRSFLGMRWHGGFSDHLPVYVDLVSVKSF